MGGQGRRLASSFHALIRTIEGRLATIGGQMSPALTAPQGLASEDDVRDDELADEAMDLDEAADLEWQALALEKMGDIQALVSDARRLPPDTKVGVLVDLLGELRRQGYRQAMVFTQYTDTMDFLRERVVAAIGARGDLLLRSRGRGTRPGGRWQTISREATKQRFRQGRAEIMVCTDAAAEGLNFQFCGALINYDMPWNPMRVEQRIGRIDRLGQQYPEIRIVNLHYADTVEADVYDALRNRIHLFERFVGRLQPILARLPQTIAEVALGHTEDRDRARASLVTGIESEVVAAEQAGFDLDEATADDLEEPERQPALYGLKDLGLLLTRPDLLPPGIESSPLGRDRRYLAPGMTAPVQVTTNPDYYEQHPDSTELWSPGSPVFADPELGAAESKLDRFDWKALLKA